MKKAFSSWHHNAGERTMTKKLLAFKQAGVLQVKPPTANGPFNGSNGSTLDAPSLTRPSDAGSNAFGLAIAGLGAGIGRQGPRYQENQQMYDSAMRLKVERDRAVEAAAVLREYCRRLEEGRVSEQVEAKQAFPLFQHGGPSSAHSSLPSSVHNSFKPGASDFAV